jgi:hypothetical protein
MVRVVFSYGPTSPRLRLGPSCPRAELSGTPSCDMLSYIMIYKKM